MEQIIPKKIVICLWVLNQFSSFVLVRISDWHHLVIYTSSFQIDFIDRAFEV